MPDPKPTPASEAGDNAGATPDDSAGEGELGPGAASTRSRRRWMALAAVVVGAAVGAHWVVSRRAATHSAALLQGSAAEFGACVVAGRPPDPLGPDATRALEAMVFKRLALSLRGDQPLAGCAPLGKALRERAIEHADNFYHRAPADVDELKRLSAAMAELDLGQRAEALARKPPAGAPASPTTRLIADLARSLQLSCKIAQAEGVFDPGACPLLGEPARARSSGQAALIVDLGQRVADVSFEPVADGSRALLSVSVSGRGHKRQNYLAGESGKMPSAWRTLALPAAPELPKSAAEVEPGVPHGRRLRLDRQGASLLASEIEGDRVRVFEVNPQLSEMKLRAAIELPADSARAAQPAEGKPDDAAGRSGGAGARHSPRGSFTPALGGADGFIPLASTGYAHARAGATAASISYFDATGALLKQDSLGGHALALFPGGQLLLRGAGPEPQFAVWALSPEGATEIATGAAQPVLDPSPAWGTVATNCGHTTARYHAWLSPAAPPILVSYTQGKLTPHPLPESGENSLACGACPPLVLHQRGGQLNLVAARTSVAEPGFALATPVVFDTKAASSSVASCTSQNRVVAYLAAGVLLVQRLSPSGASSAPVELARPNEFGAPSSPRFLVLPVESGAPDEERILLFFRRAGGQTRASSTRIEVLQSTDGGHDWR